MEIRLLGPVEVHGEGVISPGGPRQRAVLAALALRANEAVSTGYLVDAVWEEPPASPGSNIRTYVLGLRKCLRGAGRAGRLLTRPPGYLLMARHGEVDVQVFEELAGRGAQAFTQGRYAEAAQCLRQAQDLWHGEPLEGLTLGPALRTEAAWLAERRLAVAERYVRSLLHLGRYGDAVGILRRLVTEHPLREDLWAELIRALRHSGRDAEGLDAYHRVRLMLADELGVDPGEELRALHRAMVTADPDPRPVPPEPVINAAGGRARAAGWPRQLPMNIAEFSGRAAELARLRDLAVDRAGGRDPTVTAPVVCLITGMAGAGKTRLAICAAHQLTERGLFDEVQLYADLGGCAPDRPPTAPAAVLESFLRLLGTPADQIPAGAEDRARLYRASLAGRRALVLLDNAAGEEQVRPLLPGGPSSFVLVTSRRNLSGLDGAQLLLLEPFSVDEAVTLLARVAGEERVAAEPNAAALIAERCGCLPLAVAVAARRLQARPMWSLGELAGRLAAPDERLSHLAAGNRDVGTAFDLSYRVLPPAQQRMFRLLALHPGQDATAASAAELADLGLSHAERILEALLDKNLVHQTAPGRYRLHDLLRIYAAGRAEREETEAERRAAVARAVGWYLRSADAALRILAPLRRCLIARSGRPAARCRTFTSRAEALAWFEAERVNLAAARARRT